MIGTWQLNDVMRGNWTIRLWKRFEFARFNKCRPERARKPSSRRWDFRGLVSTNGWRGIGRAVGTPCGPADCRSAPPSHREADSLGLSNRDDEESAATEVSVCLVDAHDDCEIDWRSVWGQVERGLGRPVAGAVGVDLPASAVCGLRTEPEPG